MSQHRVKVALTISGLGRLFGGDLSRVIDAAQVADAAGIHQLLLPDHLAMGPRLDRYPFAAKFPYPPEEPWLEPLTTLAAISAVTRDIRLSTGVLIAPLRSALLLAKSVATLDVLSRGRLDLGIGIGWQAEEFVDSASTFAHRAGRMDDVLRACRRLWEQDPPVSFSSPSVEFADLWSEPRPVQSRLPLWFGGGPQQETVRRIAELGDGWLPLGQTPDEIGAAVGRIRTAFTECGRDSKELAVRTTLGVVHSSGGTPDLDATFAPCDELATAGVTMVSVTLGRLAETQADIESVLGEVGAFFA